MIIIPTGLVATVKRLKATIDSMCNVATAAPSTVAPPSAFPTVQQCNCAGMAKWISVNKTTIGTSTLRQAATLTFIIPSIIPSNASEVLIHVAFKGTTRIPAQDLKVFIQIGSTRYENYLLITAINGYQLVNSDSMWFPMPPNRRVYLTTARANGEGGEAKLYAIGYR